jgi:hypothetical protein
MNRGDFLGECFELTFDGANARFELVNLLTSLAERWSQCER